MFRNMSGGLICSALMFAAGCMHPGYGNYPYQPMYAPPAGLNAQPGALYIPPSDAPLYAPQGTVPTYDGGTGGTGVDTWGTPGSSSGSSTDGQYYDGGGTGGTGSTGGGGVPFPQEPGSGSTTTPFGTGNDLLGRPPGT